MYQPKDLRIFFLTNCAHQVQSNQRSNSAKYNISCYIKNTLYILGLSLSSIYYLYYRLIFLSALLFVAASLRCHLLTKQYLFFFTRPSPYSDISIRNGVFHWSIHACTTPCWFPINTVSVIYALFTTFLTFSDFFRTFHRNFFPCYYIFTKEVRIPTWLHLKAFSEVGHSTDF